jgi:hypothetical protein
MRAALLTQKRQERTRRQRQGAAGADKLSDIRSQAHMQAPATGPCAGIYLNLAGAQRLQDDAPTLAPALSARHHPDMGRDAPCSEILV